MRFKAPVRLTPQDRQVLEARARSRSGRADEARRARVVLMLADGETYDGIQEAVGCGRAYVSRWRGRFLEQGVEGMSGRHKGRGPTGIGPRGEGRMPGSTTRGDEERVTPRGTSQRCGRG